MKLYKVRKEVKTAEGVKRYTNFYLGLDINGVEFKVAIQPVNFGQKSNRTNYSILSLAAVDLTVKENE